MAASRVNSPDNLALKGIAVERNRNMKGILGTNQFLLLRRNRLQEGLWIKIGHMTMITRDQPFKLMTMSTREICLKTLNRKLRSMDLELHQVFMNKKDTKRSIFHRINPQEEKLIS